jgi:hypothetical protein
VSVAIPALAGLVGVIAGSIVTGGVQAVLARFDRRLASRSAARLLYVELHVAKELINELRNTPNWERLIVDWHEFGVVWAQHREALARVLTATDFLTVAQAFSSIGYLALARDKDAEPSREEDAEPSEPSPFGASPQQFKIPGEILDLYVWRAEAASLPLFKAALTWWEKRRERRPAEG